MKAHVVFDHELRGMLRERSFVFMVLLELLLVSSSGLLSIGYVIMTSPEASSALGRLGSLIYVGVVSDTRDAFSSAFRGSSVNLVFYDSLASARRDFRDGVIDAVVSGDITEGTEASVLSVTLPSNSPKAPLTKLALKKVLVDMESGLRQERLELYRPEVRLASYRLMGYRQAGRQAEIYYIFTLPLLLFLPCLISGSLIIDSLTQDFESRRILNLLCAPITPVEAVFGKAMACVAVSVAQSAVWLAVLSLTFMNPENHLQLILTCAVYSLIFTNVGAAIALHARRMRASQVLYTFASMSAISLYSPFANMHPLLLSFSPAHILAKTALGAPYAAFAWQYAALLVIAAASTLVLARSSRKITEI